MAIHILTEEQQELKDLVKEFALKELKPYVRQFDESGEFPLEILQKAFEMGLHILEIPEEFGGSGLDFKTTAIVFEELAKVDAGFAISLVTTFVALRSVIYAGNDEQKKIFADKIVPGGFGAFCLSEPNSGTDAASLRATAVRDGDEYVLNGTKCFVTNGGVASVYVVFATTDRSQGAKGISAFIVERDRAGLSVGNHENKMGLRLSNTTDLILEDVRVPVGHRLGEEGDGFKIAMSTLNVSRAFVGTLAVGICQAAIDEAVKFAKERKQFGKPIGNFQLVQGLLADMQIQTEAARNLVQWSMDLMDRGFPVIEEGAITKTFCGDTVVKVTTDAVQIFGGYGVSKEYPVEKLMRDSKVFQIFEGTNQIQRVTIARQMLRD